MQRLTGYMAGANLGGWLSQYREYSDDHFDTFITEPDIQTIASWGMDHIRVPVDYPVLQDEQTPGATLERGFARLDACIEWASKYGLNVVLDVHRAPGFSFSTPEANTLFTDPAMQERFLNLWRTIARRYASQGDNVVYELLNEIVEPDSLRWNPLAERLIGAIREADTKHRIIVGGIRYNAVTALKELPIFTDPGIIYNFHMYEPIAFTHQFAQWNEGTRTFARKLAYPGPIDDYREYAKRHMADPQAFDAYARMDRSFIEGFLKPAAEFLEAHDVLMYCGEYGVIDNVDLESRENWSEDVSEYLLKYGIGRAVWSYKRMGFTLIDEERRPVSERLVRVVSRIE